MTTFFAYYCEKVIYICEIIIYLVVLIKSISGIRGTIHKNDTEGLSSTEILKCIDQFFTWINANDKFSSLDKKVIVIGRDGRVSGKTILSLIINRLMQLGINIIDLGLTTTPSVQMAVLSEQCVAGIMVSASHNPINWNGLKLLNSKGEFLSKKESLDVFNAQPSKDQVEHSHNYSSTVKAFDYKEKHIESILDLVDVDVEKIKQRKFKIVVDGINSSGGFYVPYLLEKLGVDVIQLNCNPNGHFAHNPEPIPKNLQDLCKKVIQHKADLGVAVDPDVDRLVLICEDGSFFGEEYTIVSIAKYILSKYPESSVVSNLSTTMAVKHVADDIGARHFESAVGEINVVELMKKENAIIGGEGSGGVIFAPSHYGRDALVGIALFLSYLSTSYQSVKKLKSSLPHYYMLKEKFQISNNLKLDFSGFLNNQIISCEKKQEDYSLVDGIKIFYQCGSWAHIRTSNTEPLVRLIIESNDKNQALDIKDRLINDINNYLK